MPDGLYASDLIAVKGQIYVWDGKPISLEASEGGLTRSVTPGGGAPAGDTTAWSMFSQMGPEQVSETGSGSRSLAAATGRPAGRQLVSTHGKGPVSVDVIRDKNETAALVDVRQQGASALLARLKLKVGDKLGSVEFLDVDRQGRKRGGGQESSN